MTPENERPTFAFEQVAAKLEPFDLLRMGIGLSGNDKRRDVSEATKKGRAVQGTGGSCDVLRQVTDVNDGRNSPITEHALAPIFNSGGLVFPYNPTISESVSVKYDAVDLTHTNESYHIYRSTDNIRINIGDAIWTCDTFDSAIYAMAVIHFFRTYSMMDFGAGKSGRPPSPMWFSAYGNYAYHRVPVLMEKADWTFPNDVDYVGIPEFGSTQYKQRELKFKRDSSNNYTWLPMKFIVSGISLVVQHAPSYWTNFDLKSYRSGEMLRNRKSFHLTAPSEAPRK
jgi:hypothetical protein